MTPICRLFFTSMRPFLVLVLTFMMLAFGSAHVRENLITSQQENGC